MNANLQQRLIAAAFRTDRAISGSPRISTSTYTICRFHGRQTIAQRHQQQQPRRHASSSSSSSSSSQSSSRSKAAPPPPPKHTVLDQPDSFRPPSHGSRLRTKARSTTASYGNYGSGGNYSYAGGYNQGTSEQEKERQKERSYPNMFPNEGTLMHWFLTNKTIHIWISLGTLTLLSLITLTQSFIKTSPFAHLLPPLSSIIFHPIDFVKETMSAVRLHIDYTSEQTAEKRRQNILDAQKRRLYRRAHGMEDLEKDEGEGIDVTGLVDWDDGMTGPERKRKAEKLAKERRERGEEQEEGEGDVGVSLDQEQQQQRPRPKVKRWLGIWE